MTVREWLRLRNGCRKSDTGLNDGFLLCSAVDDENIGKRMLDLEVGDTDRKTELVCNPKPKKGKKA
jgi:hypothetical protein